MGQGQFFGRVAVDISGSALPRAAKSNRSRYQSLGVRLCVCNQWAVDQLSIYVVLTRPASCPEQNNSLF